MSDIVESRVVNGRVFELRLRKSVEDRERWVGWISVPGKTVEKNAAGTVTGLSESEVRDHAYQWMLKYKS